MPVTNYLWDDRFDTVVMEKDGSGTTQAVYHSDPVPYGRLYSMRRNGKTYNYRYDGQGSTCALTDETGQITDTYKYDAWGNERAHTGTTINPYRFIGQQGYQYNEETQDYYVRERPYEPKDARWKSKDPLGFVDGLNAYVYAGNGPAGLADPSGFQPVFPDRPMTPDLKARLDALVRQLGDASFKVRESALAQLIKELRLIRIEAALKYCDAALVAAGGDREVRWRLSLACTRRGLFQYSVHPVEIEFCCDDTLEILESIAELIRVLPREFMLDGRSRRVGVVIPVLDDFLAGIAPDPKDAKRRDVLFRHIEKAKELAKECTPGTYVKLYVAPLAPTPPEGRRTEDGAIEYIFPDLRYAATKYTKECCPRPVRAPRP